MARKKKTSELTAGIFVLVGLAAIMAVVLWLGLADVFRATRRQAWFYVDEATGATGLTEKSDVFVGSTWAGRIAELRFDPNTGRTIYVVDIRRDDVQIRADANASYAAGLLGGSILIVTGRGSGQQPPADRDHPVRITQGGPFGIMAGLAGKLGHELDAKKPRTLLAKIHGIADDLKKVSARIEQQMDPNQATALLAKIHAILDDLNGAAKDARKFAARVSAEADDGQTESLLARIRRSLGHINDVTTSMRNEVDPNQRGSLLAKVHKTLDDVNEMTAKLKPRLKRTMENVELTSAKLREYVEFDVAAIMIDLRQTSTKILKLSRDFASLSGEAKEIVVLNRDNIDEMIDNMTAVSADLKAAGKDIRRNPWRLLYKPKKDEIHSMNIFAAARDFSNGAEQLDQALAKLKAIDPKAVHPDQIKKIREHLKNTFEKFAKAEEALWKELNSSP